MRATIFFLITLALSLLAIIVACVSIGYGASKTASPADDKIVCNAKSMAPFWTSQSTLNWTPSGNNSVGPLNGFSLINLWNSQRTNTASGYAVFSYENEKGRLPASFTAHKSSVLWRLFAQPKTTTVLTHLIDLSVLVRYAPNHMSYVDVAVCMRAKSYPNSESTNGILCTNPKLQTAFFAMRPGGSLYMQAYYPDLQGDVLPLELQDKRDGAWLLLNPGPKGTPLLGALRSPFTSLGGLPAAAPTMSDWQDTALPTFDDAAAQIKDVFATLNSPSQYAGMRFRITSAGRHLGLSLSINANDGIWMWPLLFVPISLAYTDATTDSDEPLLSESTPSPTQYRWLADVPISDLPDPKTAFEPFVVADVHRAELFPYFATEYGGATLVAHGNQKGVPRLTIATISASSTGTAPTSYTPIFTTSLPTTNKNQKNIAALGGLYAAPDPSAFIGTTPLGSVPFASAYMTTINPVDLLSGDVPTTTEADSINVRGLFPLVPDSSRQGAAAATTYTITLDIPPFVANSSAVPYNRFTLMAINKICPGWIWTNYDD